MRRYFLHCWTTGLRSTLIGCVAAAGLGVGAAQAANGGKEAFDVSRFTTFAGAFLAARTADYDSDSEAAIALYRKALGFEPDNEDVKRRLMITLFMNGRIEEGIPFAEALKDDPAIDRVSKMALGLHAIARKDYAKAETLLAYDGPNDLDRLLSTLLAAWARFGEGKSEEALKMIETVGDTDWFEIFKTFHLGVMAAAAGRLDEARDQLKRTLTDETGGKTAPDTYLRAVMALSALEARAGNTRAALDAVATGESFSPGYPPLDALRRSIEEGRPPEAQIETAQQGAAAVLYTIGSALNRQGAEEIVTLYLRFSRHLDPENPGTLVLLGGLAEDLKRPEEAIRIYESIPENSPMRRLSDLQLGLNLADTGKVDEAVARLKALIEEDTSDMRAYLALGSVFSEAKRYREMADTYDRAVSGIAGIPQRPHWNIFFQRGIAYERLKDWAKAEPNFRRALELYPDQPQVLNYLGYSWIDMNMNLDEGMDMIQKAVSLRPNDGYIVDSLGWAHYRLGDYADAVTELERAVELRPGDATINDHLGDAYWRVGRRLEAVFQWNRALISEPEDGEVAKIEAKIENGLEAGAPTVPTTAEAGDAKPMETAPAVAEPKPADKRSEAAPSVPGSTAVVEPARYEVKRGQTLWRIANEVMGDPKRYDELIRLNPELGGNPDRIFPGQILRLPAMKP